MTTRNAQDGNPAIVAPSGAKFKITDTKLYVPVVILSKENDTKLLEQLKSGFKRTIKRNKYRSQMTIQPQNNNLNHLTDFFFFYQGIRHLQMLIDYLFCRLQEIMQVIKETFFSDYIPKVKIKDFNVLIDGKKFL